MEALCASFSPLFDVRSASATPPPRLRHAAASSAVLVPHPPRFAQVLFEHDYFLMRHLLRITDPEAKAKEIVQAFVFLVEERGVLRPCVRVLLADEVSRNGTCRHNRRIAVSAVVCVLS